MLNSVIAIYQNNPTPEETTLGYTNGGKEHQDDAVDKL